MTKYGSAILQSRTDDVERVPFTEVVGLVVHPVLASSFSACRMMSLGGGLRRCHIAPVRSL